MVEGLREERGARSRGTLPHRGIRVPRDDDDRHGEAARAQALEEIEPVHRRKIDVQNEASDPLSAVREKLLARAELEDRVELALEQRADRVADRRIVFDNADRCCRSSAHDGDNAPEASVKP